MKIRDLQVVGYSDEEGNLMSKGIELYKNFIDGLVARKNSIYSKWILGDGYPDVEENKLVNEFLNSLTNEQKEILAKIVQDSREDGIHDTLAYINEMIECAGLTLSQDGENFICNEFDSMHFDFVCRCEGDEWPE